MKDRLERVALRATMVVTSDDYVADLSRPHLVRPAHPKSYFLYLLFKNAEEIEIPIEKKMLDELQRMRDASARIEAPLGAPANDVVGPQDARTIQHAPVGLNIGQRVFWAMVGALILLIVFLVPR